MGGFAIGWREKLVPVIVAVGIVCQFIGIYAMTTMYQCEVCGADATDFPTGHRFCEAHAQPMPR